jgi:hypothetical protein
MFDRSNSGDGPLCVAITLTDGQELKGKFIVPPGRALSEVLNGPTSFVEFEPFGEPRIFIAKSTLGSVSQINIAQAPSLAPRLREEAFADPFAVLGLTTAEKDEVHRAYIELARLYHADRFETVGLPPEVNDYLSAMARRINAAYEAVKVGQEKKKSRSEPVFATAVENASP